MFDIKNDRLFWYYTGSSSHGGATGSALANFLITDTGSSCIHGYVDRWGTGWGRVPTLFLQACVEYAA